MQISKQKLTPKWITDLIVKHKTIILLEANIGEKVDGLGFGDDFLDQGHNPQKKESIN